MEPTSLDFVAMSMGLFGGLAIFLFGMDQMTSTLKAVAGDGMKRVLARLTKNRFKAVFAGAFVTAVIQSSSVTTVLVVGFVSAGLMSVRQSIGMIMGAEIGTTVTAQIIAFKVTSYALIAVAGGFALQLFSRKEWLRQYGLIIFGLGLIFFGMLIMGDAMKPLRSYEPFIELMRSMDNPLLAILISALFTALVQSSSATTAIVITLANSGFISLEAGIALVFGANIGTCATALLACIGKPREALQAALVHLTFNVAGVCLWFGFIDQLAEWVTLISPTHSEAGDASQRLMAETPRQIANAHTIFNVANTFVFIWFTGPLAAFVQRIAPLLPEEEPERIRVKYLDDNLLDTPALAFDRVLLELGRTGEKALEMIRRAPHAVISGDADELDALEKMDDEVDVLHDETIAYLGRLSFQDLTESQSEQLHDQFAIANYIENMADVIETSLISIGRERLENDVHISDATLEFLTPLIERVSLAAEQALTSVTESDPAIAQLVIDAKAEVSHQSDIVYRHLVGRVGAQAPHRLPAYRVETELVEALKRLFYVSRRIAKVVAVVDMSYLHGTAEA
jgi:phosphate:Na+ symporter